MNAKLKRLNDELERTGEKIAQLQARQRELEQAKQDFENEEIVRMVRGASMDLETLAALLKGGAHEAQT